MDIERINRLPIDEYINVIKNLTETQREYYNSNLPINEGKQHTKAVFVDSTMEEEIKKGTCVDADTFLKKNERCLFEKMTKHQYINEDKRPQKLSVGFSTKLSEQINTIKNRLRYFHMKHINEEIKYGDFSSFDKLTEEKQVSLMKNWDDDMQLKYLMREPTISQEEFYEQLDKIVNGTFNP